MWSKAQEADTDIANMADVSDDADMDRKRNWINLAQLELAADATLSSKMLYKPALRFHGLTGGLWGPPTGALSTAASDSRPPSYHVRDPIVAGYSEAGSTYGSSIYNGTSMSAKSPLTLRRRNTLALVLMAVALLAVTASAVGLVLHFMHPDGMLRANVRFIVANRNFTGAMANSSSTDFAQLSRPLCSEMDRYFLTSGLSHFYLRCDAVSLKDSSPQSGVAVHLTLDFHDNSLTNDAARIKGVILQKAGRQRSRSTLYLVMHDLLIYLRSLHVQLEVVPLEEKFEPSIPWRNDLDFIDRLMKSTNFSDIAGMKEVLTELVDSVFNMTSKLNTMQGAIDYINTTFHEQNKPIQILVDTLENITVSLDNLNKNLHDINNTLNKFKAFLKGLNSNIFKIDDIVHYLDDSISNLENSALFIDSSIFDVTGTIKGMTGTLINVGRSLKHINQSVIDVNGTSLFTDQTLDSMNKTLQSLDKSIYKMNWEVERVTSGLNGINMSLNTINDTVQNSFNRLDKIHGKVSNINETVYDIDSRVKLLTEKYNQINATLNLKNESLNLITGTMLEVLGELAGMGNTMRNLTNIIHNTDVNLVLMNDTLSMSLQWIKEMMGTLSNLNITHTQKASTIQIRLKDKNLLDTVNLLLHINSTLFGMEQDVHSINGNLDHTEEKINNLANTLQQLGHTLDTINSTFLGLNNTLYLMNATVYNATISLVAMNTTLIDVDGSTVELEATYNVIQHTLDTANDSVINIFETAKTTNQTISHIGETLENVNDKSDYLKQSTLSLQHYISNLMGTLPELNSKLYNANQSMTMIQGKENIITESFDLLQTTITGVNMTITALFEKLQETNDTLSNVNEPFEFVNTSIWWMEDSYQQLIDRIGELHDSFSLMKTSFSGMDQAFPNMERELEQMNTTIDSIKKAIHNGTRHLTDNLTKRDSLLKRYFMITNSFDNVSKSVAMLKDALELIKHDTKSTNTTIIRLVEKVNIANEELELFTNKMHYINKVVPTMKAKYKNLNQKATERNKDVALINGVLDTTVKSMEHYISKLGSFPNIQVPIKLMKSELITVQREFQQNTKAYLNWSDKFNESFNILWDSKLNQRGLNETIDTIRQMYEGVNNTLLVYESVINSTFNSAYSTLAFLKNISNTLQNLNETMEKVYIINNENLNTDKTTNVLKSAIAETVTDLAALILRSELAENKLQNLSDKYGHILESYNATGKYNRINETTYSIMDTLKYLNNSLVSVNDNFMRTTDPYSKLRMIYANNDIALDENSNDLLQEMSRANFKANRSFSDINGSLDVLSEILKTTHFTLNNTEASLENLVEDISKYNYVDFHLPILENKFEITTISFSNIIAILENTTDAIDQLFDIAAIIKNRTTSLPNVNISIAGELNGLQVHNKQLDIIAERLKDLKYDLEQHNTNFSSLNATSLPKEVIQRHYERYQKGITFVRMALRNITTELTNRNKNISSIQQQFTYLLSELDNYEQTKEDADRIDIMITHMNKGVSDLMQSYNTSLNYMKEIQFQLEEIERNYTNFSTKYVDFSDSYVHDAVYEMVDMFSNLFIPINNVSLRSNKTSSMFYNTSDSFRNSVLNENDIRYVVANVASTFRMLEDNTKTIGDDVKDIFSQIDDMESSLLGINGTIHITNKTLFFDRQKELLANRTFPSMVEKQRRLNKTINNAELLINRTYTDLNNIIEVYEYVNNRTNSLRTVNISTDNIERLLQNMNDTIMELTKDLVNIEKLFQTSDGVLWTDTGERYSDIETVNEIKERYAQANRVFDQLTQRLNGMVTSINGVNANYTLIENKLSDFNTSLDTYFESRNRTADMINKMKDISDESIERQTIMDNIKSAIESFILNSKAIEQNYSHINETFLSNQITPFKIQLNETLNLLSDSSLSLLGTMGRIQDLQAIIRNLNTTINGVINTPEELDDAIATEVDVFNTFNRIIPSVNGALEMASENITILSKKLNYLESAFDDIIDTLLRKEKADYFDKHFPTLLNKYNDTNTSLLNSRQNINYMHDKIGEIHFGIRNLKQRIEQSSTVNIPTSDLETNLTSSNISLTQNEVIIEMLSENLEKAESLFSAADGKFVGDNETLVQLQTRYRELNETMLQIDNALMSINASFKQTNKTLTGIDDDIIGINLSINELHTANDRITNLTLEMFNMSVALNRTNQENKDLQINVNELNDLTDQLQKQFQNLRSPAINETWPIVTENLADISALTRLLGTNIGNISASYNDDYELLSKTIRLLNVTFNTSDAINDSLKATRPYLIHLRDSIAVVSSNVTKASGHAFDVSNVLTNVSKSVEKLRQLLIQTQKEQFVKENAPKLQEIHRNISRMLSEIAKEVNTVHINANLSHNRLQNTNDMVNTHGSINISLADISKVISAKISDMILAYEIIESVNDSFVLLDDRVITITTNPFRENQTFEIIKETYQNMSDTLISMLNTISQVNEDVTETSDIIQNNDHYISDITTAVNKYQLLKDKTNTTDTRWLLTRRDLLQAEAHVKQLQQLEDGIKTIIQEIKDRFVLLKNASLHNNLELIANESSYIGETIYNVGNEVRLLQTVLNQTASSLNGTQGSMNEVIDTLTELDAVINFNIMNLEGINSNISEVGSSLFSLTPRLLVLNNKTRNILENVTMLKRIFLEQEKQLYIDKVTSQLHPIYNETHMLLDTIPEFMIVANTALNDSRYMVYHLLDRINNTPNVNMQLKGERMQVDITGGVLQSADETITHLTNAFLKLDTDLLNSNGSVFNTNTTIDVIQKIYERFNNTMQQINANLTGLLSEVDIAHSGLSQTDGVISKLDEQLNGLDILVLNATILRNQLSVLNDKLLVTENSSITLGDRLETLESTIIDINSKYKNVNNTGLQSDLSSMSGNLRMYKEQYEDFVNKLSSSITKMAHLKSNSSLLTDVLQNTSKTDAHLQIKIKTAVHVYMPLAKGIESLKPHITNISNELQLLNETIAAANKAVHELEEKLRQQQIVDYIKQHFPDVLEQYILINETIDTFTTDIDQVSATLRETFNKAVAANDTIQAHTEIYLSVEGIAKGIHNITSGLNNVTEIHEEMMMLFHELGNQISNSFDDNETLYDIRTRFGTYNHTMNTILSEYKSLSLPLNNMQQNLSTYDNMLTNYITDIAGYDEMVDLFKEINSDIIQSNLSLNDTINTSGNISNSLKHAIEQMYEIQNAYVNVNSSVLHMEKDGIMQSLVNENFSFGTKLNVLKILQDLFSEIVDKRTEMANLLSRPVSTYEDLHETYIHANETGRNLSNAVSRFNSKLGLFNNDLLERRNTSKHLRKTVNELERDFRYKQKIDYIANNLPRINGTYITMKEKLNQTLTELLSSETTLQLVNASINNLSSSIYMLPTINISLEDFDEGIVYLKKSVDNMFMTFKDVTEVLSNIDMSIATKPYLENETLAFVVNLFNDTMDTLNEIETALTNIDVNTSHVFEKVLIMDKEHSNIANIIQEFIIITSEYNTVNTTYANLDTKLSHTANLLDNITEIMLSQQNTFEDIISTYNNTSNADIQNSIDKFSHLIDYVAVRNPLVNKLYNKRLLHQFTLSQKTLYDAHELLNSTYSTADILNATLVDVADKIMNVSLESKAMSNTLFHYEDEGTQLHNTLRETQELLTDLVALFKEEFKRDLMRTKLPAIKERHEHLYRVLKNISISLNISNETLNTVSQFLEYIDESLATLPTFNVSTSNVYDSLNYLANESLQIGKTIGNTTIILDNINFDGITNITIPYNQSISYNELQSRFQSVESLLSQAEKVIRNLSHDVSLMDGQISETDETLTFINETLILFMNVQGKFDQLGIQIDSVNNSKLVVDKMLADVETYVSEINNTLNDIKLKYDAYGHNTTLTEEQVKHTHKIITKLRHTFLEASNDLELSNKVFRNITNKLYLPEDDKYELNETLHMINSQVMGTLRRLKEVNITYDNINKAIPSINVSLGSLDMDVKEINITLTNEERKSNFRNKTLPLLEEKYNRINLTIEMTNVTLGLMHEQIEQLNAYVTQMKNRLHTFPTINISLTDIDDNITQMESRLEIMKDYYNNVQEIVLNFQTELASNNILGNNISLADVDMQYKNFNDTLEMVDTVLSKIDYDFTKMDDHFNYINDTLGDVDDALDTFEKKDIRIKSLNKELTNISNSLQNTNLSLSDMVLNLDVLSERFQHIQEQYANVTDSTEEENTMIKQQLLSVNDTLRLIDNTVDHLFLRHDEKSNKFDAMNATLFQQLGTMDDLSSALIDVKQTYQHIKKSLANLTSASAEVDAHIVNVNSSLDNIMNSISTLNNTLYHEQQKFNFVNRNIGPLDKRFNELLVPFVETNTTIISVRRDLENTGSRIDTLINTLNDYPTVNISYSEQNESIQRMKEEVDHITNTYIKMKRVFNRIGENLTDLTDRSGDLSDILANYKYVNKTLGSLKQNITAILQTLKTINSNTSNLRANISVLNSSLTELSNANTKYSGVDKNVTLVGEEIKNSSMAIQSLNDTLHFLYDKINDMIIYYENVSQRNLTEALNNTLKEVKNKIQKMIKLSSALDKEKLRHGRTLINRTEVEELLNSTIRSEGELNIIIQEANTIIAGIAQSIHKTHRNTVNIYDNATTIQLDVSQLEDELQQLNESLYEEKSKQDFIEQHFPKLNKQYGDVNETLISTNATINDIYTDLSILSKDMNYIQNRLNEVEPVYISLETENKTSRKIKAKLQDLTKQLNIVSDIINRTNIESLNDSSGSFAQVREKYANFTNLITDLQSSLNNISNNLWKASAKVGPLKTIFGEVNKTVNSFLEVKSSTLSLEKEGNVTRSDNKNISDTIQDIATRFKTYNISLQNTLTNYSHINDENIITVRDAIINSLKNITRNINDLNASTDDVRKLAASAITDLISIDMKFHSNASDLSNLMLHIKDVNDTTERIRNRFGEINEKQDDINNASNHLSPEIKKLLNRIENLTKTYVDEQRKLDFIADNKFDLLSMFLNKTENMNVTKRRISATGINLVALKTNITKTGGRLDKFMTLVISTAKESEIWDALNADQQTVLAQFNNISKLHHKLLDRMKKLDNRNKTLDEMRHEYAEIRTNVIAIQEHINTINNELGGLDITLLETSGTLSNLTMLMDRFKQVQQDARKTKNYINQSDKKLTDTSDNLHSISEQIKDVTNMFSYMVQQYKPIEATEWKSKIPEIKDAILMHNNTIDNSSKDIVPLLRRIEKARNSTKAMKFDLANNVLHRSNITNALNVFETTLQNNTNLIASVAKPVKTLDNVLLDEKTRLDELERTLTDFNESLHNELLKQVYINETLPLIQHSHISTNASHATNGLAVDEMISFLSSSREVLNKIKEKMKIFGVEDTDNSVKEWTNLVNKLNATATALIKQHIHNGETLQDMENKLWKPVTEMYTNVETLNTVQERLSLYNATLNRLKADSHNITALIEEMVAGTRDVIGQLIERDTILTTTPPTTTPSGPPEWMSFTSTETGVIGRDKGQAVCSVGDLSLWSAMKIVRQGKDGRKQTVAAWVLGRGARKTITDRRIRVLRVKDEIGGKLQVNIRSLQCKDEGTYYCSINSHHMWPLTASIAVKTLPQDSMVPTFPTEVFEDKIANFSCTGSPGYPHGRITWKIKHDNEPKFRDYIFYSAKSTVTERDCIRRESIRVQYQFDMSWNNTRIRCYIENTDYYAEGIIRLLPYDICNKAQQDGTIAHPYTPHKYIICGKALNVMQCPGSTCFDATENNCIQCKAEHGSADPCYNKPPYSYVPHESDCKKYYICMGPNRTLKRCSRGYFHPHVPGFCTLSYARSWCSRQPS